MFRSIGGKPCSPSTGVVGLHCICSVNDFSSPSTGVVDESCTTYLTVESSPPSTGVMEDSAFVEAFNCLTSIPFTGNFVLLVLDLGEWPEFAWTEPRPLDSAPSHLMDSQP